MNGSPFSLHGRVALVTGGTGVLGGTIATGLAAAGAKVAVLGRRADVTERKAVELRESGTEAVALMADVMDVGQLQAARERLLAQWGRLDILVNAAGGNVARARDDNRSIFEVPLDAFDEVLRLNLHGTVVPSMVFGEAMAQQGRGCIVNISSMAALQTLSGVGGYGVAKAGIDNYTRYLAVQLARRFGDGIRVNAIAPGFFLSEQNRALLVNPDGSPRPRAQTIFGKTPMGRFGKPEEVVGAVVFLCSDAASFITGVVLAVDGGFSAFSGV
jgi:NAD(P)-dependent dehydrogenase (short-subunit alcohol dehydrogenase family)